MDTSKFDESPACPVASVDIAGKCTRRQLLLMALGSVALAEGLIPVAAAQSTDPAAAEGNKLILGYRMLDWRAKHVHDAATVNVQVETLRKLGCEVKTAQHDGHSDVQYRTVYWKSLALDSDEQLQQWKTWLEAMGFDVLHGQPAIDQPPPAAGGGPREIVKYRLTQWRSQHIHQAAEVGQLMTLYRALACELEKAGHDGHTDLKYRCPEWKQIELPSHTAAHKWQEFLQKAGFETSHQH